MHDLDLAFRFFEKLMVMDRGRIVATGSAHEIFDDARLDAAFGVKFERLKIGHHSLLRPACL
jgi:ABC-type cobalamin/Fe3+-siderophores transport system ATPase subunit